jgi:hypothetical protein
MHIHTRTERERERRAETHEHASTQACTHAKKRAGAGGPYAKGRLGAVDAHGHIDDVIGETVKVFSCHAAQHHRQRLCRTYPPSHTHTHTYRHTRIHTHSHTNIKRV